MTILGCIVLIILSAVSFAKSRCSDEEFSKNLAQGLPPPAEDIIRRIVECNHWKKLFFFGLIILNYDTGLARQSCEQLAAHAIKDLSELAGNINEQLSSVNFDPELLASWTVQSKLPCDPPFKVTYKKGKKQITFLAVEHISEPVPPEYAGLKTIRQLIEKEKPQSVFIEMVSGEVLPPQALDEMNRGCYKDGKFVCGEAAYAAIIAGKNCAEVQGGEPIPPVFNETLLNVESKANLLAYRSVQAILSFKRQGLSENEWPQRFSADLKRNASLNNETWSYSQFSDWLKSQLKSKPGLVASEWIEPRNDKSATALQKIAFNVDSVREPLILSKAAETINKQDKTMIIYGASHFFKQAPAFEKALGAPQIECLNKK